MRIGLLADTHIPREVRELPPQVKEVLSGVDLILHGGDIYELSLLDELEEIAPVLAARGNGDTKLPDDPRLKIAHLMTVGGLSLGLAHAVEYPELDWYPLEKSMQRFFGGRVDILVCGDSHVPVAEECKGVVVINSGSPSLPWGLRQLGTVGLLQVDDGLVEARIIDLSTGTDLSRLTKNFAET
jgi:putative phosphoesterase